MAMTFTAATAAGCPPHQPAFSHAALQLLQHAFIAYTGAPGAGRLPAQTRHQLAAASLTPRAARHAEIAAEPSSEEQKGRLAALQAQMQSKGLHG